MQSECWHIRLELRLKEWKNYMRIPEKQVQETFKR